MDGRGGGVGDLSRDPHDQRVVVAILAIDLDLGEIVVAEEFRQSPDEFDTRWRGRLFILRPAVLPDPFRAEFGARALSHTRRARGWEGRKSRGRVG